MGMARRSDGFRRPCLCYPAGGAGKTGNHEDNKTFSIHENRYGYQVWVYRIYGTDSVYTVAQD
jgi:hypothetical protein